jgi:hypothetical protein
MKIKTSELTGAALDWAVAVCEGWKPVYVNGVLMLRYYHPDAAHTPRCYVEDFGYSTDWAQGGPIIEREGIATSPHDTLGWAAFQSHTAIDGVIYKDYFGPTPLIAAMRCYVASKLGDEVDVPEELTK